jgi:hypothetical protein
VYGITSEIIQKCHQFIQKFNLSRGLQEFGKRGGQAAMKEMKQLHERIVFEPINIENLTSLERKRAIESLIFLTEKRNGEVNKENVQMEVLKENVLGVMKKPVP